MIPRFVLPSTIELITQAANMEGKTLPQYLLKLGSTMVYDGIEHFMVSEDSEYASIYPASDLLYEEEEKKEEAALKEVNIGLDAPALPSIASNVATGGLLDGPVIPPPAGTIFEPIPGSGNAVDLNYLDGLTFVISPPNDPNYRPAQEMIQNFGGSVGINVTKKQVSLAICRSIGNLVAISFIVSNPAFFKTFLSSWQM